VRAAVRAAALCLLAGCLLSACTRPALSRSEYRGRAAALCHESQRSLAALPRPGTATQLVPALRRLRSINRRLTNRIAVLDPPLGTDRSHDAAIAIGQRTDRTIGRLTAKLETSSAPAQTLQAQRPALAAAATRDDRHWARLHLKACAGGPSRSVARLEARPPRSGSTVVRGAYASASPRRRGGNQQEVS
jgi:hypothetical protein